MTVGTPLTRSFTVLGFLDVVEADHEPRRFLKAIVTEVPVVSVVPQGGSNGGD